MIIQIETYKRLVYMLSSYKSLDRDYLNEWITNDHNDNGNNGSANKRRHSIRTLRPNYHQATKFEKFFENLLNQPHCNQIIIRISFLVLS